MRFITYQHQNSAVLGVVNAQDQVFSVNDVLATHYQNFNGFISQTTPEELANLQEELTNHIFPSLPLEDVPLLAPIPQPLHDVLCVGVNYAAHAKEAGHGLATDGWHEEHPPVLFGKRAQVILGTGQTLPARRDLDSQIDYECELAVIIGKTGKDIPPEKALDYVFGYSVFNDFSSRQLQKRHLQWLKGKSLDGYTAMGPWIITADDFSLTQEHHLETWVNGQLRQQASLTDMLTAVPEIIASFSEGMTLHPGDIIATGTPAGVAMGMDEPHWLQKGDVVNCRITGLGELINRIG